MRVAVGELDGDRPDLETQWQALVAAGTGTESSEKWEAGVRVAAVTSGAYWLSTNRAGGRGAATFGGGSLIADPEGLVVARTRFGTPLAVADIDLGVADRAKHTYPRYVDASSRRTSVTGATFR